MPSDCLGLISDVTQRKEAEFAAIEAENERARKAALPTDPLTGLGNRVALMKALGVSTDERSNAKASNYATSVDGVFAAGDARRVPVRRGAGSGHRPVAGRLPAVGHPRAALSFGAGVATRS